MELCICVLASVVADTSSAHHARVMICVCSSSTGRMKITAIHVRRAAVLDPPQPRGRSSGRQQKMESRIVKEGDNTFSRSIREPTDSESCDQFSDFGNLGG